MSKYAILERLDSFDKLLELVLLTNHLTHYLVKSIIFMLLDVLTLPKTRMYPRHGGVGGSRRGTVSFQIGRLLTPHFRVMAVRPIDKSCQASLAGFTPPLSSSTLFLSIIVPSSV